MGLQLPPGEPASGPWWIVPVGVLVRLLFAAAGPVQGRPCIVGVDGRGGGGKSTLAAQLRAAVPPPIGGGAHRRRRLAPLLFRLERAGSARCAGATAPGEAVHYRPPGWQVKGRPGAIEVPAGLELVLVEGVDAGRRELAHLLDAMIWVQSDAASGTTDTGFAARVAVARATPVKLAAARVVTPAPVSSA